MIPAERAHELLSSGKEWTPDSIRRLVRDATGSQREADRAYAEAALKAGEREMKAGKF